MSKVTKEVHSLGIIYYKKDGVFHREDGPAVIYPDGSKSWYLNGVLHNEKGPALIDSSGGFWALHGIECTEEEVQKIDYLRKCPKEELPKYMNNPLYKEVIRDRLE